MKSLSTQLLRRADAEFYLAHLDRHLSESNSDYVFHPLPKEKKYNTLKNRNELLARWALSTEVPNWERVWGVWDQGKVVGHVDLKGGIMPSMLHRCRLSLGIEIQYRRHGLGIHLMKEAIKNAWAMDIAWIDLRVYKSNRAAVSLYKKCGFLKNGLVRDAVRIHGKINDELSMTLPL